MSIERVLICPDAHHPYVDQNAWQLFLKVARAFKPQHTIVLGDFSDCYQLSNHNKDPRRATMLKEDVAAVNKALRELEDATKGSKKVFIEGNHEYRLIRYMQSKAPELAQLVSIPKLFKLRENKWKHVPYRHSHKMGNMRFTHDVGPSGKHAAAKSMEAMGRNIVIGHCHRAEMIVQGTLDGERHVGFSFGWLGDANEIDYMQRDKVSKDWTLGFGVGYYDTDSGFTTLSFVPILPSCHCILHGRKFSYP
jgi:UDP-2,3-diacylglucosamine pyrophosphatase LpxH